MIDGSTPPECTTPQGAGRGARGQSRARGIPPSPRLRRDPRGASRESGHPGTFDRIIRNGYISNG